MKNIFLILSLLTLFNSNISYATGKIQNEDVKSLSDITSAVLTTTGNLTISNACISSPGSTANLGVGQFIYDTTHSTFIPAGTTIVGLPGSCSAGQIQMSQNATTSATGDTLTFGGQKSQLINDSKMYATGASLNDQLSTLLTNNNIVNTSSTTSATIPGALTLSHSGTALTVNNNATVSGLLTFPSPFTLGATSVTTTGTQLNYLNAATGTTGTTSSNVVFSASPTFTGTVTYPTPFTLGATSVTSTGTQLNYLNAATGTTGTTSSSVVFSASPTFTGTVTIPTPFTLGATSVTSNGTQLNYLNAATGTTGTTSSNVVFSASPTFTGTLTAATVKASGTNNLFNKASSTSGFAGGIEVANTTASFSGILSDSGGRLLRLATSDYNDSTNTGSILSITAGAGTGNTTMNLQAFNSGSSTGSSLLINPSGGNVGINNSTPGTTFEVKGNGSTINLLASTSTSSTFYDCSNGSGRLTSGVESSTGGGILTGTAAYSASVGTQTSTDLNFGTGGLSRMIIASTGAITLKTNTSITNSSTLQFDNNANILWKNSGGTARNIITLNGSNNVFITGADSSGQSTGGVQIAYSNGNVGFYLRGDGTITLPSIGTSSSAVDYLCWNASTGQIFGETGTCTTSSKKFKTNIKNLNTGLKGVLAMRPVSFDYKDEYNPEKLGSQVGFIAEDIEKIDRRLATYDHKTGVLKSVNYQQITAVLAKAIQEQEGEIQYLKKEIHHLQDKLKGH